MAQPIVPVPADLEPDVPQDFPRFSFAGHDREGQLLSRYLWHHFSHRLFNNRVLFNKEYLTTADLWVGGAVDKTRGAAIQEIHRADLSSIVIDDEGYVSTHQHISHAHDRGWPFPLWCQVPGGPWGLTAGWHFQDEGVGWIWQYNFLKGLNDPRFYGETATHGWGLHHVESLGIVDKRWKLRITGPSPTITSPKGIEIDAFNCPFMQVRWMRPSDASTGPAPYIEWKREGDTDFSEERRVPLVGLGDEYKHITGADHFLAAMYRHPLWRGKIVRLRTGLAPALVSGGIEIDSFFSVYDTRHTINNPIFILSCWRQFVWTGDVEFLRANMDRMRATLRYQQTEMGGLEYHRIRNPWWGHDGRPSYTINADGTKTSHPGRGIGANYWDLLPFGGDDMYATSQYYGATLAMAEAEEAVRAHPEWGIDTEGDFEPAKLRRHAAEVKSEANELFWDDEAGRFVGCIDCDGAAHDYGFTFLNLDAIWYGIASDEHARRILDWLEGKRIVEGDTSTGEDIYHWRFGPRATTRRNVEWYGQGWTAPESIPWGGQVQDGGAVLGFSFYDLMARLRVLGPDDAWQRLCDILSWEDEVMAAGGYRAYYADGSKGTTLQGGGTAGGIGIDSEFLESSLIPSIVIYGFLGLEPTPDALVIAPRLPSACPEMGVTNVLYHGALLDIRVGPHRVEVEAKTQPEAPVAIRLPGQWRDRASGRKASEFVLDAPGRRTFTRARDSGGR